MSSHTSRTSLKSTSRQIRKSNSSKKHRHRISSRTSSTSRDRIIRILRQLERVYVPYTERTKEEAFRRMKQDPVYKQILAENGGIAGVRRILGKHIMSTYAKYGGTFGNFVGGGLKTLSGTLISSGIGIPVGLALYPIGFIIEFLF
jgi:hypothetical protein